MTDIEAVQKLFDEHNNSARARFSGLLKGAIENVKRSQEAERAEWRSVELSKAEIKALQFFDRLGSSALVTKSDPSRTIVNKLIARKMLYPERRVGPGPVRYCMSAYGTLWLIHNKEKLK
jgi:hypothetical protein